MDTSDDRNNMEAAGIEAVSGRAPDDAGVHEHAGDRGVGRSGRAVEISGTAVGVAGVAETHAMPPFEQVAAVTAERDQALALLRQAEGRIATLAEERDAERERCIVGLEARARFLRCEESGQDAPASELELMAVVLRGYPP